ncbi:transposase [Nocardia sp. NBC_01329]|uniref:transposase n=1 Tax=Nocardia sp. NBC_01329 TaxID=2903594 RepID=UPI002E1321CF|nr:transposase [Nocardia sp. NBC_01329]
MSVSLSCLCSSCPAHRESPGPCSAYPSSCSDEQWELLEPLLPAPGNTAGKGGRGEKHPRRLVLDAIFYLVRGGIAWRALPTDFPPPTTVYDIFSRWTKAVVRQRITDVLRDRIRVRAGRGATPTAAPALRRGAAKRQAATQRCDQPSPEPAFRHWVCGVLQG